MFPPPPIKCLLHSSWHAYRFTIYINLPCLAIRIWSNFGKIAILCLDLSFKIRNYPGEPQTPPRHCVAVCTARTAAAATSADAVGALEACQRHVCTSFPTYLGIYYINIYKYIHCILYNIYIIYIIYNIYIIYICLVDWLSSYWASNWAPQMTSCRCSGWPSFWFIDTHGAMSQIGNPKIQWFIIMCWIGLDGDGSKPWHLVNPKIAGKWMFIPLKMVCIGIDPYPDSCFGVLPMLRLWTNPPKIHHQPHRYSCIDLIWA